MSYRIPVSGLASSLALAALCAPGAWANPTGPQVLQGSATVTTTGAVTTVTSTPGTVIDWQNFNVAPGETVRFTNPGVVNRVPPNAAIAGTVQSAGQLYFMNGGFVTAPNVQVDLAALTNTSLKFDALPASAREAGDADARAGMLLTGGKVFIIGPDLRSFNRPGTGVVLAPGKAGELGDLRIPFVRVHVAAPSSKPLDVESVVARRPQIGIFNALFLPAQTRIGDAAPTALALAPAVPKPVAETRAVGETKLVPPTLVAKLLAEVPKDAPAVTAKGMPAPAAQPAFVLAAFGAPVEDRSKLLRPIPPAPIEDRAIAAAPSAPVEERVLMALPLIPAPVEERGFAVAAAPVEERMLLALPLVPAPVEERVVDRVIASAPVEERMLIALEIVPAPVEDRVANPVARPAPAFAPIQVASSAPVPIIVLASVEPVTAALRRTSSSAVTVEAPQKRAMPRVMTDRRGGLFFM